MYIVSVPLPEEGSEGDNTMRSREIPRAQPEGTLDTGEKPAVEK